MPRMDERDLSALIRSEDDAALGGALAGDLAKERAKNYKFYLGEPLGNEEQGRSKVIVRDVAEVVDNMLPSLLRVFASQDNTCMFDPVAPDDEPQASDETGAVNHIYWKGNPGFQFTYTFIKDGLLQKNGVASVMWDESEERTREEYEGLSEVELTTLMEDGDLNPVEQDQREGTVIGPDGQPMIGPVFDITFERVKKRQRIVLANHPPEHFRVSTDAVSTDIENVRFVALKEYPTRIDLIQMGIDKNLVMGLPSVDGEIEDTEEAIARNQLSDETSTPAKPDRLLERIEILNAYPLVDYDGDGIPERRQVLWSNNRILMNEEVDKHPFFSWTPCPLPHKFIGLCPADQTRDIQEIDTTLLRQMLDNLYLANDPRYAIWIDAMGDSTLDDILSSDVGAPMRFTRPVNEAFTVVQTPFVAGQSFPMLEYMNQMRKRRTGVGEGVAGLDVNAMKNVQSTVLAQASDMATMQIEAIARIFGETGLKPIFKRIHELMRKHMDKSMWFKINNRWTEVDPREWRERENVTIMVGLGTGTREQRLIHLQAIAQLQKAMAEVGLGGQVVNAQNAYQTGRAFVENALLPSPELYFTDPQTVEPPPEKPDPAEILAQVEQMKAQVEKMKADQQHERENRKLDIMEEDAMTRMQKAHDDVMAKLTELELKFAQNVPGSAV